ncbi:unnamed protein product [Vitrella brassicaformis CCMP3155]|uniref:Uncharacterized protein n=2 Tax=Vitrella brassicaformis TaxID=1169539 RepID=A0A0G4GSF9_VITBC|nr:unnamed protein product [Vitrella brassicaformis CCMP3155]|eukprot:CEM33549.1 unnamed protein product [Vitrella brassicaformis CCMP3155]
MEADDNHGQHLDDVDDESHAFIDPTDGVEAAVLEATEGLDDYENGMDDGEPDEGDEGDDQMDDASRLSAALPALPDTSLLTISSHTKEVFAVAFAPTDPRLIVTGGCDDKAFVHRLVERPSDGPSAPSKWAAEQVCCLEGHTDSVVSVAFGFDGNYAATGGYDGIVKVWAMQRDGEEPAWSLLHSLEGPSEEVEWVAWHPKGHALLAGSRDCTAWLWWAPTGKVMQIFAGQHGGAVSCGAFGMAGKLICTGSEDGSAAVWSPKGGEALHFLRRAEERSEGSGTSTEAFHTDAVVAIATHQSLPLMATGSADMTCKVVHLESGRVLATLGGHRGSVEGLAFGCWDAQPTLLATGGLDGKIQVWDLSRYECRCTMAHTHISGAEDTSNQQEQEEQQREQDSDISGIVRLKWCPDGRPLLVSCSTDATIRLWDGRTSQCERLLTGHSNAVLDMDLRVGTGDGGSCLWVASGSDDHTCKLWRVELPSV